ncbi:hypothetical protein HanPSC8_Chr14g0617651 [Helianthus annuus]|nr:hypothetical protein HanPSC8_Chr14g0617651 [Helianthus annuus]
MGTTEVPPLIFKNFWHVRFMQSGLFSDQLGRMRKRTTLMKFMKEIAYDGVEILDNDNVSLGIF